MSDPLSPLPEDLRATWEAMTDDERDTLVYERALYRAQTERLQRECDSLRAAILAAGGAL